MRACEVDVWITDEIKGRNAKIHVSFKLSQVLIRKLRGTAIQWMHFTFYGQHISLEHLSHHLLPRFSTNRQ